MNSIIYLDDENILVEQLNTTLEYMYDMEPNCIAHYSTPADLDIAIATSKDVNNVKLVIFDYNLQTKENGIDVMSRYIRTNTFFPGDVQFVLFSGNVSQLPVHEKEFLSTYKIQILDKMQTDELCDLIAEKTLKGVA